MLLYRKLQQYFWLKIRYTSTLRNQNYMKVSSPFNVLFDRKCSWRILHADHYILRQAGYTYIAFCSNFRNFTGNAFLIYLHNCSCILSCIIFMFIYVHFFLARISFLKIVLPSHLLKSNGCLIIFQWVNKIKLFCLLFKMKSISDHFRPGSSTSHNLIRHCNIHVDTERLEQFK